MHSVIDKQKSLQTLSNSIFENQPIHNILRDVSECTVREMRVEKTITLNIENGSCIVISAKGYSRRNQKNLENYIVPISISYLQKLFKGQESYLHIKNAEGIFRDIFLLEEMLVFPIFIEEEMQAFYIVGFSAEKRDFYPERFSKDDPNFFKLVSEQMSLAWQNSLYTQKMERLVEQETLLRQKAEEASYAKPLNYHKIEILHE